MYRHIAAEDYVYICKEKFQATVRKKEGRILDNLLKLIQFQDIGNVSFACLNCYAIIYYNTTSTFTFLQL